MKQSIPEKAERLFQTISGSRFLKRELLGGDIHFFISTHAAEQQTEMRQAIAALIKRLDNTGIQVLEINLFKLALSVLDSEIGLPALFEFEEQESAAEFREALHSALDMKQVLLPAIERHVQSATPQVYFLTGIGEIYPFIRSHSILNNLHHLVERAPLVAFFPGTYSGEQLKLFGLLADDNYYRAFNLDTFTE